MTIYLKNKFLKQTQSMTTLSPSNSLSKLASFDEQTIKSIADNTFKVLLNPESDQNLSGDKADAQIGLATLIALYTRQGSATETFQATLKDSGLSDSVASYIANLYKQKVDLLRAQCANIAVVYNRIIGCDWRLDYTVSNSESGSVLLPIFFIKIKLEGGQSIDFSCSEEEMTALVATLKDAAAEAARTTE